MTRILEAGSPPLGETGWPFAGLPMCSMALEGRESNGMAAPGKFTRSLPAGCSTHYHGSCLTSLVVLAIVS